MFLELRCVVDIYDSHYYRIFNVFADGNDENPMRCLGFPSFRYCIVTIDRVVQRQVYPVYGRISMSKGLRCVYHAVLVGVD